ncbi:response regulator [Rhodococcus aetherivorans]|uniref:response regulator n=1 Tax=Rhodococcus aetherivorans TaxID=191292 RepID=UPI00388E1F0A
MFVVDGHEIVRRGLIGLIAAEPDLEIVGQAATAVDATAQLARRHPAEVVLEARLPDGSGAALCRSRTSSTRAPRCLVFTGTDDEDMRSEAVRARRPRISPQAASRRGGDRGDPAVADGRTAELCRPDLRR